MSYLHKKIYNNLSLPRLPTGYIIVNKPIYILKKYNSYNIFYVKSGGTFYYL